MARLKIRGKEFNLIDVAKITHCSRYEALLFLGQPRESNDKNYCIGVGTVYLIQKGEEFDLVKMNFGSGLREIFVKLNHARRQIYTLKRGQLAWFFGYIKFYKDMNGKSKSTLFAKGFQGWYVPKQMDIKQLDPNEIDKLEEENESKLNFLDELLKGED